MTSSSPKQSNQKIQARKVSATPTSLTLCGQRLASNKLVSFPTETVYGLGCHALNEDAIQKVFAAKERPLTDPLIVHVNTFHEARKLWNATFHNNNNNEKSVEAQVLESLTTQFWPGPLTIVAAAHLPSVPPIVMANTGFVACRSPSHAIARMLIEKAGVPIAAPSANKFGHVSPTRAGHVWDDLKGEDVWIVDPDMTDEEGDDGGGKRQKVEEEKKGEEKERGDEKTVVVCDVGVESTVIKVEPPSSSSSCSKGVITILRHGAISQSDLKSCLEKQNLSNYFDVSSKKQLTRTKSSTSSTSSSSTTLLEDAKKKEEEILQKDLEIAHVAPGQTIRHYSPHVVSYMISHARFSNNNNNDNNNTLNLSKQEKQILEKAVIIDYHQKLQSLQTIALAYRDLSSEGDSKEAASRVFEMLRWSESVEGAERVYFPELVVLEEEEKHHGEEDDALILAVKDRLTRAASGVVIDTLC